ncbi:MAG: hypothetical protein HQK79_19940 [Desulfobacterales bacterium]|nr:hypothetical protein [Desulfobacterales bacterium]
MVNIETNNIKHLRNKNRNVKLIRIGGEFYGFSGVLKSARRRMICDANKCEIQAKEIYIYSDFGMKLCLGCCAFETGYEDKDSFKGLNEDPNYDGENDYEIMEDAYIKLKNHDKRIKRRNKLQHLSL